MDIHGLELSLVDAELEKHFKGARRVKVEVVLLHGVSAGGVPRSG